MRDRLTHFGCHDFHLYRRYRVALITRRAFDEVSDYTRSLPTAPSAGRFYKKNLNWADPQRPNWWLFVVADDPTDPFVQLHHPFRAIVIEDFEVPAEYAQDSLFNRLQRKELGQVPLIPR